MRVHQLIIKNTFCYDKVDKIILLGSGPLNVLICLNIKITAVSEAQWIVGLLQWKIGFDSPNLYFEVRKAFSLFCLVQNGPGVTWVACISLRERSKWSLGCARAFLEAFWTFCNTWDTQSQ